MSFRKRFGAALYDLLMKRPERAGLRKWRRRLLSEARGTVLEIGAGTGANLPHYPNTVGDLIVLEPNSEMSRRMEIDAFSGQGDVEIIEGFCGDIPLEDDRVDTVVTTLVLCSVPDVAKGLEEIARVLRPGGKLLFLEHVASPDPKLRKWQDRLDPIWYCFNGDCHMNRRTAEAIEDADFQIVECDRAPMPATPSVLSPSIRGIARPPS